jgi:hypothetical protein
MREWAARTICFWTHMQFGEWRGHDLCCARCDRVIIPRATDTRMYRAIHHTLSRDVSDAKGTR